MKAKARKSENLGLCGRPNMLQPRLKIWEWEWIFGCSLKAISSPGVCSPCAKVLIGLPNVVKSRLIYCPYVCTPCPHMSTIYFYIPHYHCVSSSGTAMCIVIKQCCAKLARAGQGYYWQILSVASSLILLYSFPRVGGGLHFTLLLLHWLGIMRWDLFYSSMISLSFQIDSV